MNWIPAEITRVDLRCLTKEWDVFISHASEDKAALVEPLAKALRDLGAKGTPARSVTEGWPQQPRLTSPRLLRARVILDMAEADLEPGDILVTAYTDPYVSVYHSKRRCSR
jgi:hypothetical protein